MNRIAPTEGSTKDQLIQLTCISLKNLHQGRRGGSAGKSTGAIPKKSSSIPAHFCP